MSGGRSVVKWWFEPCFWFSFRDLYKKYRNSIQTTTSPLGALGAHPREHLDDQGQ